MCRGTMNTIREVAYTCSCPDSRNSSQSELDQLHGTFIPTVRSAMILEYSYTSFSASDILKHRQSDGASWRSQKTAQ